MGGGGGGEGCLVCLKLFSCPPVTPCKKKMKGSEVSDVPFEEILAVLHANNN